MNVRKKRLGDLLVEKGIINQKQLKEALDIQVATGKKLGEVLISQNLVTEKQITELLQEQLGIPFVDLRNIKPDPLLVKFVPLTLARRYNVVPIKVEDGKLHVAMEDPLDFLAIQDIERVSGREVVPAISFRESIRNAIDRIYGIENAERAAEDYARQLNASFPDIGREQEGFFPTEGGNAPAVRFVNSIIEQAVNMNASDIHIEPVRDEVNIRFRIDGMLQKMLTVPRNIHGAVITRLKIMGGMNIAERRLPQDGRIGMQVGERDIDIRMSILPTVHGEKAVLRLLDRNRFFRERSQLGFTPENLQKFDMLLRNPHGLILVTGPTGSGKTTTLYAMLGELNTVERNIVTIEDPVEYDMEGINQVQVNPKAGLTFASGLRAILRQDPDVIMIGEIRDRETAEIAVRSAITGHLVLSTLHTNDAVSTVFRLIDMEIPPYLLGSALVGVIAQRLLRKICPACKVPYYPNSLEKELLGLPQDSGLAFFKGEGCSLCNGTGYKGRIPAVEILVVNKTHREMISAGASFDQIRDFSIKNGMVTLREECIKLLRLGITSVAEVIRVSYSQD